MNTVTIISSILAGRPGSVVILFCAFAMLLGIYAGGTRSPLVEGLIREFTGALLAALSMSMVGGGSGGSGGSGDSLHTPPPPVPSTPAPIPPAPIPPAPIPPAQPE
jgi:hypothetical protein